MPSLSLNFELNKDDILANEIKESIANQYTKTTFSGQPDVGRYGR